MTITIAVPLLVALIGLVLYFLATNSKVAEVGRIMLWVGLLVFLWHWAGTARL